MYLNIILMSISLSIDALGIGLSYGIKGIIIPFFSKLIITLQSFIIIFLSLHLGNILTNNFSEKFSKYLGIIILISIGISMIYQGLSTRKIKNIKSMTKSFYIKQAGITIKIIKSPNTCDFNRSKKIEPFEALYLGMAISLDSFGVSLGIGVYGISGIILPLIVVLFQILFISIGIFLGKKIKKFSNIPENIWIIISGTILIIMALLKLI